jgi:hypothetical protein
MNRWTAPRFSFLDLVLLAFGAWVGEIIARGLWP